MEMNHNTSTEKTNAVKKVAVKKAPAIRSATVDKPATEEKQARAKRTIIVREDSGNTQSAITSEQGNRRRYVEDGVTRIGIVEISDKPENDEWVIVKEINSYNGIRGKVSTPIEDGTIVTYKRKTAEDDHNEAKAYDITPILPVTAKDLAELERLYHRYHAGNPIYEAYRTLLEKVVKKRGIENEEVEYLIQADHDNREPVVISALGYCLKEKIISEDDTNSFLSCVLDEKDPLYLSYSGRFLQHMTYMLHHFPDIKDSYYPKSLWIYGDADEKEVFEFIEQHLDRRSDHDRICGLVKNLDEDVLLRYPEYESYGTRAQRSVLFKEKERREREAREEQERMEREEREERQRIEISERRERELPKVLAILEDRGIERLTHFTDVRNIDSILENGIMSRKTLEEREITIIGTDRNRADYRNYREDTDMRDAICLSVSFPNHKMFYKKRQSDEPDGGAGIERSWCVFLLDPVEVTKKDCLYFSHNAASIRFRDMDRRPDTHEDFEGLFSENVLGKNKATIQRTFPREASYAKYATSPQAEIVCLESIPVECIKECIFADEQTRQEMNDKLTAAGITTRVDRWYFGPGPYANRGGQP